VRARRAALDALRAVQRRDAYANLVLPRLLRSRGLTGQDAARATDLTYGTLRGLGTFDAILAACADRPLTAIDPDVLDALRLGTYQLLATRVPPHAAVSTTVDLVRSRRGAGAARFANAVLRHVADTDLAGWVDRLAPKATNDPVGHRYELGTCQHELLAGLVAAFDYIDSLGWDAMIPHERSLGQRFLDGMPEGLDLYGLPTMEGRVPTFCFNVPGHTSEEVATHLADSHEVAVWWGNYYAIETMRALGLDEWMGAVRAGFVHYNTEEEVDRLLAGLTELL